MFVHLVDTERHLTALLFCLPLLIPEVAIFLVLTICLSFPAFTFMQLTIIEKEENANLIIQESLAPKFVNTMEFPTQVQSSSSLVLEFLSLPFLRHQHTGKTGNSVSLRLNKRSALTYRLVDFSLQKNRVMVSRKWFQEFLSLKLSSLRHE